MADVVAVGHVEVLAGSGFERWIGVGVGDAVVGHPRGDADRKGGG